MKNTVLRNRYTLLLTTLIVYMVVLVAEGVITDREVRRVEFENPYFDLNLNDLEEFRERRNNNSNTRREDGGDV
ncbi:MAG: hypothetical protein WDZ52_16080 [Pseudohongiellaceae bacterium]